MSKWPCSKDYIVNSARVTKTWGWKWISTCVLQEQSFLIILSLAFLWNLDWLSGCRKGLVLQRFLVQSPNSARWTLPRPKTSVTTHKMHCLHVLIPYFHEMLSVTWGVQEQNVHEINPYVVNQKYSSIGWVTGNKYLNMWLLVQSPLRDKDLLGCSACNVALQSIDIGSNQIQSTYISITAVYNSMETLSVIWEFCILSW